MRIGWGRRVEYTVNPVVPVFHLFSSGNPDFIIYGSIKGG